jgi:hypothetical protein
MRVSRSKDVSFQLPSSFCRVAWSLSKSMWTRLALVVKGIVVWRLVGMEGIVIEGGVCGDMWWGMRWDWDWWRINNFRWEEVCHHGVLSHVVLRTAITSFDMRFWRTPTMQIAIAVLYMSRSEPRSVRGETWIVQGLHHPGPTVILYSSSFSIRLYVVFCILSTGNRHTASDDT